MELKAGIAIIDELMNKYNLKLNGWQFKLTKNKRQLGLTQWKQTASGVDKVISISSYFILYNEEWVVRDVVLHEIAHAICGLNAGHGPIWKAKCREIGARPNPTIDYAIMPASYISVCKKCNKIVDLHYSKPKTKRGCFNCRHEADLKHAGGVFYIGDLYTG